MQAIDELNQLLGIGPPKVKLPLTLERSGYVAVRAVGKGGFGQAHLVFNKQRQRYYVVKHVNTASMSSKQRKEAHNEIHTLQALEHPNIVRYVEYAEEPPHLYIVMEYADGGDLHTHLKKVKAAGRLLSQEQVLALFTQVTLAIKHMHDRRMLHRDVKAQNVFLTKAHVVKLGDFGISTVLQSTMSMAQTMCGTPVYFSPELCVGKPYNNKSDVWALGVLLYEMCTAGDLPFESNNVKALMDSIVKTTPKRIPGVFSDSLADLVSLMLRKDPRHRPDINAVLQHRAVQEGCPALVQHLERLAPPAPPQREVLLADPPAASSRPPIRGAAGGRPPLPDPPARPAAAPKPQQQQQAPPPQQQQQQLGATDGKSAIRPHQHFNDTEEPAAAYKPALLAARAAAASLDDSTKEALGPAPAPPAAAAVGSAKPVEEPAAATADLAGVIGQLRSMTSDDAAAKATPPRHAGGGGGAGRVPPPVGAAVVVTMRDVPEDPSAAAPPPSAPASAMKRRASSTIPDESGMPSAETDYGNDAFEDALGTRATVPEAEQHILIDTPRRDAQRSMQQDPSVRQQQQHLSTSAAAALLRSTHGSMSGGLRMSQQRKDTLQKLAQSAATRLVEKRRPPALVPDDIRQPRAPSGYDSVNLTLIAGGGGAMANRATWKSSSVVRPPTGAGNAATTSSSTAPHDQHAGEDEEEPTITGQCLCGSSVYAAFLYMAVGTFTCDCPMCRRFTGSTAGADWIHFPDCSFVDDLVHPKSTVRTFIAARGVIETYFCGECGGSLAMIHEGIDGCVVARASLSDDSAARFEAATHSVDTRSSQAE